MLSDAHFRIFFTDGITSDVSKVEIRAVFKKTEHSKIGEFDVSEDQVIYDAILTKSNVGNVYEAGIVLATIDKDGNEIEVSRITNSVMKTTRESRGTSKLIRNDFRVASKMNGGRAYLIKVKKEGAECTSCWDYDLLSSNNSNCPVCGGTGNMKYFYKPFKTNIGPIANISGESKSTDEAGKISDNIPMKFTSLADFPLTTDDYVYSVRYGAVLRVISTEISETQGVSILQSVSVNEIPTELQEAEQVHQILEDNFGELYAK